MRMDMCVLTEGQQLEIHEGAPDLRRGRAEF